MRYRAGQEPAFDLKRLLVAACKEAGLEVLTAWMTLDSDRTRLIEFRRNGPAGRIRARFRSTSMALSRRTELGRTPLA
jgi:hypothetical protein